MAKSTDTKARAVSAADVAVGQRIRIARLNKGMSQTALGRAIGVSFQQLQKYEKGVNRVGASRLRSIADTLDLPISAFFSDSSVESHGDAPWPLDQLLESRALRLLKAFNRLTDPALKQAIVDMVESSVNAKEKGTIAPKTVFRSTAVEQRPVGTI